MLIPTKFGEIESDKLIVETGLIDDAARFARYWEFRRPGETELGARYEQRYIDKTVDLFPTLPADAEITTLQGGEHVPALVGGLERRDEVLDNENEFTRAVEYRRPGSPEVLHRSVYVQLKRLPEDNQTFQGFVG